MRILHTSDWHLGRSLYDFSLLEDQRDMLDHLLAVLERRRMDAVIIAGDIYDRPVPPAAAVQLYDHFLSQAVGRMGIPVFAVAGNHDSASRLEFGSSLYASSGYYVTGQVRAECKPVLLRDEHGPVSFWPLPYLQPADVRVLFPQETVRTFDDAYRALLGRNLPAMDTGARNVAIAHGFFSAIGNREDKSVLTSDSEVNVGGIDICDSGRFAAFDYAALGHLHAPQRAGSEHIRYSGSPLKYSLSEERQRKSVTLVELGPKGSVNVEALPLKAMRDVRTIRGSLDDLLEPSRHTSGSFDDYVFADLLEESALYPMEKLRTLFPRLLGLRLLGGGEQPEIRLGGSTPKLSPEEMFARFYRETKGHDLPEESRRFLREALARAREVEE